ATLSQQPGVITIDTSGDLYEVVQEIYRQVMEVIEAKEAQEEQEQLELEAAKAEMASSNTDAVESPVIEEEKPQRRTRAEVVQEMTDKINKIGSDVKQNFA